jgi:hypothetical protein
MKLKIKNKDKLYRLKNNKNKLSIVNREDVKLIRLFLSILENNGLVIVKDWPLMIV